MSADAPDRIGGASDIPGGNRGRAGLGAVWERDGRDWPHREHSRFVQAGGQRWHVQVWGSGPPLLLLHGTGASTHSWRDVAPLLASRFTVVVPDLPGHGFTDLPVAGRLSLPGMAWGVRKLLAALDIAPALAAGHSAGAAVMLRSCLDGGIAPRAAVSVNGALLPMRGLPGHLFAPIARIVASVPIVPLLLSWRALDRAKVERLIRDTGSTISPEGINYYARLMQSARHIKGALGMMAQWNLQPLARDLPRLATPLTLLIGDKDKAIPPAEADRIGSLLPKTTIVHDPNSGHLTHEEDPALAARVIEEAWDRANK